MNLAQLDFKHLFNLSPEGIYISNQQGNILFANNSYFELIGVPIDSKVDLNIYDIIAPDYKDAAKATNDFLFANIGEVRNLQVNYITLKNETKWIDSITTVQMLDNTPVRIAFVRDKTEWLIQQRELIALNKRLKDYAFLTSHKLRHPIANIIGLIDLLKLSNNKVSELEFIQDGLLNSANQLNDVVQELHQALGKSNFNNRIIKKPFSDGITRIMLVDDDKINNYINKTLINKYNKSVEVIEVLNGRDALNYLVSNQPVPDVILLDITMPVMNGWEFIEHFKKLNLNYTKLLILTTSVDSADRAKAMAYGLDIDFVSKPLNISILQQILQDK
jgi:CheY-like chemotaxis protein